MRPSLLCHKPSAPPAVVVRKVGPSYVIVEFAPVSTASSYQVQDLNSGVHCIIAGQLAKPKATLLNGLPSDSECHLCLTYFQDDVESQPSQVVVVRTLSKGQPVQVVAGEVDADAEKERLREEVLSLRAQLQHMQEDAEVRLKEARDRAEEANRQAEEAVRKRASMQAMMKTAIKEQERELREAREAAERAEKEKREAADAEVAYQAAVKESVQAKISGDPDLIEASRQNLLWAKEKWEKEKREAEQAEHERIFQQKEAEQAQKATLKAEQAAHDHQIKLLQAELTRANYQRQQADEARRSQENLYAALHKAFEDQEKQVQEALAHRPRSLSTGRPRSPSAGRTWSQMQYEKAAAAAQTAEAKGDVEACQIAHENMKKAQEQWEKEQQEKESVVMQDAQAAIATQQGMQLLHNELELCRRELKEQQELRMASEAAKTQLENMVRTLEKELRQDRLELSQHRKEKAIKDSLVTELEGQVRSLEVQLRTCTSQSQSQVDTAPSQAVEQVEPASLEHDLMEAYDYVDPDGTEMAPRLDLREMVDTFIGRCPRVQEFSNSIRALSSSIVGRDQYSKILQVWLASCK